MNIASYVNSIHSIYAVGIDIEPFIVTIDKRPAGRINSPVPGIAGKQIEQSSYV